MDDDVISPSDDADLEERTSRVGADDHRELVIKIEDSDGFRST